MPFQQTVGADMPWGIPGELALGLAQNVRAEPVQLSEAFTGGSTIPTAFGRAMTKVDAPSLGYGTTAPHGTLAEFGGDGVYLGLLANPKAAVSYGAIGSSFNGLEAGAALEVVSECPGIWVLLTTAAAVGDAIAYAADGQLAAAPAQVAPANHTLIAGSRVVRFDVNAGLAMVALQQLPAPAAAE